MREKLLTSSASICRETASERRGKTRHGSFKNSSRKAMRNAFVKDPKLAESFMTWMPYFVIRKYLGHLKPGSPGQNCTPRETFGEILPSSRRPYCDRMRIKLVIKVTFSPRYNGRTNLVPYSNLYRCFPSLEHPESSAPSWGRSTRD